MNRNIILCFSVILSFFILNPKIYAEDKIENIKQNIDEHSEKIKKLEEEIKTYSKQIEVVSGEAKNLQNTVKELDINQKKINTEINKTQLNIKKTNLVITDLTSQIKEAEESIENNKNAISKTIKNMQSNDSYHFIENILNNKSIGDVFNDYESILQFQKEIQNTVSVLKDKKNKLEIQIKDREDSKKKLTLFKEDLDDKNKILDINKKEKSELLKATKNKETVYKTILANKQAEKEKFEQELFKFESELKKIIDPKSFPTGKKGILSWPLESITLTQAFGKTIDAKKLYVSGTHNGVDFRASRGTPVKSVLNGVISNTGNTDLQRGCYSYGKWILIKHPNGLSSLYAHLDVIKVEIGQNVNTGDTIGLSGQTGYATGPHLHLTLYATQGVEVQRYTSSKNCKNVDIPVSGPNAYLDPMLYF